MLLLEFADKYHNVTLIIYALYLIAAAILVIRRGAENQSLPTSFLLISVLSLALLRAPSIFVNYPFNPDEAQYLAAALKFNSNMNSWLSADIETSGPLNAFVLMWPFPFGLGAGFAVAHMTALALLALTWLFLLSALRSAPVDVRIFIGGATILFLGGLLQPDFLEFTSELVPCCLIMLAAAVTLAGRRPPIALTLAAGLALGAVPFAKLQGTPIALTIGLILLFLIIRKEARPWRSSLLLAVSACLPAALILTPLTLAGGFSDFWTRYVQGAALYTQAGWQKVDAPSAMPAQAEALIKMMQMDRLLKYTVLILGAISLVALSALLTSTDKRGRLLSWGNPSTSAERSRVGIAALILVSGVLAAAWPAREFMHYAYFIIWPAMLFTGSAWALARSKDSAAPAIGAGVSAALGISLVGCTGFLACIAGSFPIGHEVLEDPKGAFLYPGLLPGGDGAPGRALVWGWMQELYVWSGWTPAIREQNSYHQIWPTPMRDYFRERMMAELRGHPPDYIVDAVGDGAFGFTVPRTDGIASFSDLAQFVSENYTLVSRDIFGTSCPRLYANQSAAVELEKTFIAPVGVSAAAGSETAEAARAGKGLVTCVNSFSKPANQTGRITLGLGATKAITAVEILNMPLREASELLKQQANRPHGLTGEVRFYSGEAVKKEEKFAVPAYPKWISVKGANPVEADKIVIEAEGFPHGLTWIRIRQQ